MSRKYCVALSVALFSLLTPGVSSAVCTLNGVIVRVLHYEDAFSAVTSGWIYFRTSSLAPYYYTAHSTDDDTISNAIAHMNSGRTVSIQGNIALCPAVPGAGSSVTIGRVNYIVNP